jgi:hypothetical protein
MEKIRVKRDGEKDLSFTGQLVASASSQWVNGKDQTRWNEIEVYQTAGGKWVYSRAYITRWQGEACSNEAHIFETAEQLVDYLAEGGLTPIGKEILEQLAKVNPDFERLEVEEIG